MRQSEKFKAFCYYYLTPHIKKPFGDIHDEWFEMLENEAAAFAAPRGFGKTHVVSNFYPLFKSLEGKEEILLVSSKAEYAEKNLIRVRDELEHNGEIIADYGVQKTKLWRNDELKTKMGSSIIARGFEGKIRGLRPSLIIVDDIEDDELVRNENRRKNLMNWFREALLPCRAPESQIVVVGTLLHDASLLATILNNPPKGWITKKYRALEDGKSVWEENWPTIRLEQIRDEIGPEAFEQEYQNNPIPDELRKFKKDNIRYYDSLPEDLVYTTTVDPAISLSKDADYTAIVTVGTDKEGTMYVAEALRKRMLPDEVLEEIWRTYKKWSPHRIGIEVQHFQKMLKYQFEKQCQERGQFPNIMELNLDISPRGRKKQFRIEALQPLFHNHRVLLNENQVDLETELLSYPGGQHDDLIDALSSQLEIILPYREKQRLKTYPTNTFGHFWQRQKIKSAQGHFKVWHDEWEYDA